MLYIKKSTKIPQKITDALNTAKENCRERLKNGDTKAARNAFDDLREIKKSIKECLIIEQHGLCAYCMQTIQGKFRIEHWKSLSKNTEDSLEYENMLGVCYGGEKYEKNIENKEKDERVLCCDASKGNKNIIIDPRSQIHMNKIRYDEMDLLIYTEPYDENLERDINDILHLNGQIRNGKMYSDTRTNLIYHRREAYKSYQNCIESLRQKYKPSELYQAIQHKIKSIENAKIYPPFAGVILYFLKRELKKYK